MTILPIYLFNQPVLKKKTKPVEEIDDRVLQLVDTMFETMHHASGVGLAANQIGISRSITVIDVSDVEEEDGTKTNTPPIVLINPVIEHFSEEEIDFEEGCLSLPDLREIVVRPEKIQVRFFDTSMHEHVMEVDGILARVMQHEIDHLNGIYFFERLTPMRKALVHAKLKRIQKGLIPTDYPVEPYKPHPPKGK